MNEKAAGTHQGTFVNVPQLPPCNMWYHHDIQAAMRAQQAEARINLPIQQGELMQFVPPHVFPQPLMSYPNANSFNLSLGAFENGLFNNLQAACCRPFTFEEVNPDATLTPPDD